MQIFVLTVNYFYAVVVAKQSAKVAKKLIGIIKLNTKAELSGINVESKVSTWD